MIALHGITSAFLDIGIRFDSSMISVQNLFNLIDLPGENNENHKEKQLQILYGKLEFFNVTVKYGEKIVLSNLSCKIEPGTKIAVIGRTGAGKSTMFKTILRLVNPSSGTILLDDNDYLEYSSKNIRKLIAINPQSSIIFYGSLRKNLDPLERYSNERIISVIVSLKLEKILYNGLDDENFGKNTDLSIGENQLFSLARTLLKNSKIVLIDEPTSSVDTISSQLMHVLIKEQLKESTILTISHREDAFKDYDYYLLIDYGVLKEYGPIKNINLIYQTGLIN